jgi:hypothetical protein
LEKLNYCQRFLQTNGKGRNMKTYTVRYVGGPADGETGTVDYEPEDFEAPFGKSFTKHGAEYVASAGDGEVNLLLRYREANVGLP